MKVGSSLDSQIWYEPYHANMFKLFMKTDLLRSFLMKECKVCNVFWFLVLINPVLVTSKQVMVHLYPEMSVRKCEYFFIVSVVNVSHHWHRKLVYVQCFHVLACTYHRYLMLCIEYRKGIAQNIHCLGCK